MSVGETPGPNDRQGPARPAEGLLPPGDSGTGSDEAQQRLAQGGSAGLTREELTLMGHLGLHFGYDHPLIRRAKESGQGPVGLLDELIAFERRRVSDEHGPSCSVHVQTALPRLAVSMRRWRNLTVS